MSVASVLGRIVQWLLLLAFIAAAVPVLLMGLLRSPAVRDATRAQVSLVIGRELGLSATIADVDLAPLSFALVARSISLDHPTGGRLLDAGELRIRPSFRALLRGAIDLNVVGVDRATLFLKLRDGAFLNLPELPKSDPSEPDAELDLPFNALNLSRARVVLDGGEELQGEVSGIELELEAADAGRLALELSTQGGFLRHARGEEVLSVAELQVVLESKTLAIDHARVETQDARLLVDHALLDLPEGDGPYAGEFEVAASVWANLDALARLPEADGGPLLSGTVSASASVRGKGKQVTGTAEVLGQRIYIDQFGLGEQVVLEATAEERQVVFNARLKEVDDGGTLTLSGQVAFEEGYPLSVSGQAREVSFGKLMKQLGVTPNAIVDWNIGGRFSLAGPTSPLQLRGDMLFDTRDFRITKGPFHARPFSPILYIERGLLDGGVRVTADGIVFQDVDVTMPRSRLEVSEVLLGFDNALRVRAQGAAIDLKDVTPLIDFELDGQGSFDVRVDGQFNSPTVAGSAEFKRFSFASFPFGDLKTRYHLEKDSQAVRFTEVAIDKDQSHYTTDSLFIDFTEGTVAIDTRLRLSPLHIKDFYHIFHYEQDERFTPYQGQVAGDVVVRYTLGFPGDSPAGTMHADMDLSVPEVDLDGYRFRGGSFTGQWHWLDHSKGYEGGILRVKRFALRKGAGTASISGKMGLGGKLNFVVLGDRIAVQETEGVGDRIPKLTGHYAVMGTVRGTPELPRADLDVTAAAFRYGGKPLGQSRLYVRLTDKHDPWISEAGKWPGEGPPSAEACAHGRRGLATGVWPADPPLRTSDGFSEPGEPMAWVLCGSILDGQGEVDMAVGRTLQMPLRGRFSLRGLPYGRFMPSVAGREPLAGRITGELDLTGGGVKDLSALSGRLHLTELTAGQFDVRLNNDGPVEVAFDEGSLDVQRAVFRGPRSQLEIHGGGSSERGLALTIDGAVDLSLASHFSSTVQDATGRLDVQARIQGSFEAPSVYGHAEVLDASFNVGAFPSPVTNVSASVRFSERRAFLEQFSAQVLGGRLGMGGSADLSGRGLGRFRLVLEADGMSYRPREGISVRFGGRSELAWRKGDRIPRLSGVLRVDEARYGRDIQVGRSIQDMYRKERKEVSTYVPDEDTLALDLQVVETRPLRIENNLIDAEVSLDNQKRPFRIVGTDQRFGVLGNMSIRRGTIRFRDTTFIIRDGEFEFDEPTRVDPTFDVRAVTDVRRSGDLGQNWHITLHAWGNREDMRFDLASDPQLSQDDIALLLTLGITHSELAQLNAGDLTGTAALEALATVSGVEREVRRALPTIDDFRLQSAYSARSNRTEPQLFIGKRIADRVRLSAATGVGASRDFRTGVELQVSDQTSVQAGYNNQNAEGAALGDVGVDLRWRLEFD